MNWLRTTCGLLLLAATARAAEKPVGEVLIGCPDPHIIAAKEGDGFYIFCTGQGIPIWHSSDLLHWQRAGRVFSEGTPAWAKTAVPQGAGIWAPDIAYFAGQYYLYYSVSGFGSQRSVIGLAVNRSLDASRPDYRWEDRGLVVESAPGKTDFNAIDAAPFVDRDGKPYLFWGSFWSGIKAARLDPASGKLAAGPPGIVAVAARKIEPYAIEGAYVIFHEGYYYLFVSWDHCCKGLQSDYKMMVGRSRSVLGPYGDFAGRGMSAGGGTLLLASSARWRGPGHNSVLQTKQGDWLVHHTYDAEHIDRQRILQIRPLYWLDGWPLAGQPLVKPMQEFPAAEGKLRPGKWQHAVEPGAPLSVEFHSDGSVQGPELRGTWRQKGATLTLRWHHLKTPTHIWNEQAIVEPGGTSYVGRNAQGQVVFGTAQP